MVCLKDFRPFGPKIFDHVLQSCLTLSSKVSPPFAPKIFNPLFQRSSTLYSKDLQPFIPKIFNPLFQISSTLYSKYLQPFIPISPTLYSKYLQPFIPNLSVFPPKVFHWVVFLRPSVKGVGGPEMLSERERRSYPIPTPTHPRTHPPPRGDIDQ